MTINEASQVFEQVSKLNPQCLDVSEQLVLLSAMNEFAEKVKPIVVRHLSEISETSNFLMKLQRSD